MSAIFTYLFDGQLFSIISVPTIVNRQVYNAERVEKKGKGTSAKQVSYFITSYVAYFQIIITDFGHQ